jgi:hypothetical protein
LLARGEAFLSALVAVRGKDLPVLVPVSRLVGFCLAGSAGDGAPSAASRGPEQTKLKTKKRFPARNGSAYDGFKET